MTYNIRLGRKKTTRSVIIGNYPEIDKMADIAMCLKKDCPSFEQCYRAQATANEYRQAYGMFDNAGAERCDDYVPVSPSSDAGFIPQRPSKPYPPKPIKGLT